MNTTAKWVLAVGGVAFCAVWLLAPGTPQSAPQPVADTATQNAQSAVDAALDADKKRAEDLVTAYYGDGWHTEFIDPPNYPSGSAFDKILYWDKGVTLSSDPVQQVCGAVRSPANEKADADQPLEWNRVRTTRYCYSPPYDTKTWGHQPEVLTIAGQEINIPTGE